MDLRDRTDLPYRFFKPKNSSRWNIRYSIKGHSQIKRALGTADDDEALAKAAEIYQRDTILADHDALVTKNGFRSVARAYVKWRKERAGSSANKIREAGYTERVVERYLIPAFKNKAIDKITFSDIAKYQDWRRTYWTTGPGATEAYSSYERGGKMVRQKAKHQEAEDATLRREKSMLTGVFKFAAREGFINKGDIPTIDVPKGKSDPRPAFTREQFGKLFLTSNERLADCVGNPRIFYERGVLHCFINFAVETGLRPGEIFNLDWGHIEGLEDFAKQPAHKDRLRITAYGKGKPPRPSTPGPNTGTVLMQMRQLHQIWFGEPPTPETPVFRNKNGERMRDVKKSLRALLDAAGLREDGFGRRFSSYSFRHTYATWQMEDPVVDSFKLAKNMRTSVRMIEDYYGQVTSDAYATIFRGEHRW